MKPNPVQYRLCEYRDEGFDARMKDNTLGHNPYGVGSIAHERWNAGWRQADRELRKIDEIENAPVEDHIINDDDLNAGLNW